jgi:hypothetical protein
MSEKLETNESFEAKVISAEHEARLPEHAELPNAAEQASEKQHMVEAAQAELQGLQTKETSRAALREAAETSAPEPTVKTVNRELKKLTLKQELRRVQRREKLPARALSKVVHQPVVRVASEAAGKTVSRPSGLLGGGVFAFIGGLGYLYFAKHIGVQYNYLLSLLFFVAGFILGLLIELGVWAVTRRRVSD